MTNKKLRFSGMRARMSALAVAALLAASCTLIGSREVNQCERGCPSDRYCSDKLCLLKPVPPSVDAGDSGTDAAVQCRTTNECPQDQRTLCIAGECRVPQDVKVGCPLLLPTDGDTFREDGAIIVGFYLKDPENEVATRAIQFALSAINAEITKPPILGLLCAKGESLQQDTASSALAHLGSLRAPVVVGDFEVSELEKLALAASDRNIAVWSTRGNAASHPSEVDASALRYFVDELESLTPAYQDAFNRAVSNAEKLAGVDAGAPIKVAMVTSGEPEFMRLADRLKSTLKLHGQLLASTGAGTFMDKITASWFKQPNAGCEPCETVQEFRPNVILGIGGDEIVEGVLSDIETTWGATPLRPVWLLSSRSKFNRLDTFATNPGGRFPLLKPRVVGVDFGGDKVLHGTFLSDAHQRNITEPRAGSFDHLYDAAYVVALAAVVADKLRTERGDPLGAVRGDDFAQGLSFLQASNGNNQVFGAKELTKGVGRLRQGEGIHFIGTTGPWVFDHGRRRMDQSYFCFQRDQAALNFYLDASALADETVCARP